MDLTCAIAVLLPQYSAGGRWTSKYIETQDSLGNLAGIWDKPEWSGYVTFYNDTEGVLTGPPQGYLSLVRK